MRRVLKQSYTGTAYPAQHARTVLVREQLVRVQYKLSTHTVLVKRLRKHSMQQLQVRAWRQFVHA